MDFITHLPRSVRSHDAIWEIVNRLMKSAHFLPPVNLRIFMTKMSQWYIKKIMRLHGLPPNIILDKRS